jgi:hypothetical protein
VRMRLIPRQQIEIEHRSHAGSVVIARTSFTASFFRSKPTMRRPPEASTARKTRNCRDASIGSLSRGRSRS